MYFTNFDNLFPRMLQTLLSIPGADPAMITVFIDGYFEVSFATIFALNTDHKSLHTLNTQLAI